MEKLVGHWPGIEGWVIVHGQCPTGADKMADDWAQARGVEVERHPADWQKHHAGAGFIRNAKMVELGANICIAFVRVCTRPKCARPGPHGSHGATDAAAKARRAGIPIMRIKDGY